MKRLGALVLVGGLILAGCRNVQEVADFTPNIEQEQEPSAFSPLAIVDVIEIASSGEIKNMDRFQTFLEHAREQEPDHIQIVQFTTEGDPVSRDLQFNGTVFESIVDSSRDTYGSGGISEAVCSEVTMTETAETIDYRLDGCENKEEIDLLVVWK